MKRLAKFFPLFFLLNISILIAHTSVANIFQNNMVLQQGIDIPVWGTGSPNNNVKVAFKNQSVCTKISDLGRWEVYLSPESYGGPYELLVISEDTIKITNVLVGEVWLASGQSNMNMPLGGWGRIKDYKEEIAEANYPNIRLCTIPLTVATKPAHDVKNISWSECNSKTIELYSAVAYFFGRKLYKELNIPIGLVHVSKGGTPIESWMSKESLSSYPEYNKGINFVENGSEKLFNQLNKEYKVRYKQWISSLLKEESGLNEKIPWFSDSYSYSNWEQMEIPNAWEFENIGEFDGVVWFKKEVELNDDYLDSDLTLNLGAIQDADITFLNGVKPGKQLKRNSLSSYKIPQNILRRGKNIISVFILDHYGVGGLWDKYDPIELRKSKSESISLNGVWFYKKSINLAEFRAKMPVRPLIERYPSILYNGMIAPLIPFAMRGVIWYQGESNSSNAYSYRELFSRMITDWREKWGEGKFPFLFVQLANYLRHSEIPVDNSWAVIRESQAKALELENTGMATAIDIGDEADVHPKNKQEVGRRLAFLALAKVYSKNIEFSGPMYKSFRIVDDTLFVSFSYAKGGLKSSDGKRIRELTISASDRNFKNANAKIRNDEIAVWADGINNPVAVRYAWQSNPNVNLINKFNLPTYPFRTDNWEVITQEAK